MTLAFDRFRFDRRNSRLEGPDGAIPLNPKAFDVLGVLIERAGELVSKDELLDAVWPEAHVADGVLKVNVAELRKALGDSATTPRFIETVHRRGYRFVAAVSATGAAATPVAPSEAAPAASVVAWPVTEANPRAGDGGLVGRGPELAMLEESLTRALAGERQVVLVTGEAGAGKTALVDAFLADAGRRHVLAISGCACMERFGPSEAYAPILEALSRFARKDSRLRALLPRYAPSWLAQLPWLVDSDDGGAGGASRGSVAPERMLREMVELMEAIAEEVPFIIVVEDAHWSDPSTVDLMALVSQRREQSRLLAIATFRPAELILTGHPLRQASLRMLTSRRATEIPLGELDVDAVGEYLARRFPGIRVARDVAGLLRARTDGNALFLVTVVDDLVERGVIAECEGRWEIGASVQADLAAVPESLRRLIAAHLERLDPDDRRLLEAASLAGTEFAVTIAAAADGRGVDDTETRCTRLAASGSLLRQAGVAKWPNGGVSEQYAFRHALYAESLAASLTPRRRAEAHARIGAALESAYGTHAVEIAATLAVHFSEGGDRLRAVQYRRAAAATAASRHALVEAEAHLDAALAILEHVPPSPERDREELLAQSAVGAARMATRGYSAAEVVAAYTRVVELSGGGSPEGPEMVPVLWGLWSFNLVRGKLDATLALAERIHAAAAPSGHPLLVLLGHQALATTQLFRGELADCRRHLDEGEPLYDRIPEADRRAALAFGQDPKVAMLGIRSIHSWHVGLVDTAVAQIDAAIAHAESLEHPMSIAFAMAFKGWLLILRREPEKCLAQADASLAYATEQQLPHWVPGTLHARGWARVQLGELETGIGDIEQGLQIMESLGAGLGWGPRAVDLAVAYARTGRVDEARTCLDRASAALEDSAERYAEAELRRVEAELVMAEKGAPARTAVATAAELLRKSAAIAERQGARTAELQARVALARLGKGSAASQPERAALARLYATFDEGQDTADLREAREAIGAKRGRG